MRSSVVVVVFDFQYKALGGALIQSSYTGG